MLPVKGRGYWDCMVSVKFQSNDLHVTSFLTSRVLTGHFITVGTTGLTRPAICSSRMRGTSELARNLSGKISFQCSWAFWCLLWPSLTPANSEKTTAVSQNSWKPARHLVGFDNSTSSSPSPSLLHSLRPASPSQPSCSSPRLR